MSPTIVYLQACSLKDEPISSQMQLISLTHSDSCDSLFVTELLVHTNLYIRSSRRWSSLIGGSRTLKHCVKIHQITPCFCLVFFFPKYFETISNNRQILPGHSGCNGIRTFLNSWIITSLLRLRQVEITCPAQDLNLHHTGKGSIQTDILHT